MRQRDRLSNSTTESMANSHSICIGNQNRRSMLSQLFANTFLTITTRRLKVRWTWRSMRMSNWKTKWSISSKNKKTIRIMIFSNSMRFTKMKQSTGEIMEASKFKCRQVNSVLLMKWQDNKKMAKTWMILLWRHHRFRNSITTWVDKTNNC